MIDHYNQCGDRECVVCEPVRKKLMDQYMSGVRRKLSFDNEWIDGTKRKLTF